MLRSPVCNGFSEIARHRGTSLFQGEFFSARFVVRPLKQSLIYLPTAPVFLVVVLHRSPRQIGLPFIRWRMVPHGPHDSIRSDRRAVVSSMGKSYPQIPPKTQ